MTLLSNGVACFSSIDLEDLLNLPCYVFCKDIKGIYTAYNDYGAINLGFNNGDEIVGKSDLEIFPGPLGKIYRDNDIKVITEKHSLVVAEEGLLKKEGPIIFLCYKFPILNTHEEVTHVLGMAFAIPQLKTENLVDNFIECAQKRYLAIPPTYSNIILSKQETRSVEFLCQGFTSKQIAKQLNISHRTVELYVEHAKEKLGCRNKVELIVKFLAKNSALPFSS